MSREPLARVKTTGRGWDGEDASWLPPDIYVHTPSGTEVEVWRPGDRPVPPTYPTYEEVRAVIVAAWRSDCPTPEWIDLAAHNMRLLITGEDPTEEDTHDG